MVYQSQHLLSSQIFPAFLPFSGLVFTSIPIPFQSLSLSVNPSLPPSLPPFSPGVACLPPASVSILFPPSLLSEHTPAYHPPSPLWSKNRVNTHTQRSAKKHESTHTHTYTALYHSQFGPGLKTSNGGGYDRKTTGGTHMPKYPPPHTRQIVYSPKQSKVV